MENYPQDLLEFEDRFKTEEDCRKYMAELRWPNGFVCPKCGHHAYWFSNNGHFCCQSCNQRISITSGTIFEKTRTPLRIWFRVMWHIVGQKNGVSAKGLQHVIGASRYETVWLWLHKLRTAMVRPGRERLSGIVEVDEAYIGGKKEGKRGRGADGKSLVLVAVEDKDNKIGRIRLLQVPDATASSLISNLESCIETGSSIRTDGWKSYLQLTNKGYKHTIARKTEDIGENLLPLAHRVISLLKRWINGTHQGAIEASHLSYYLDEFTFRFNRRTSRSRGKLFYRLLQQAMNVQPVTDNEIRRGRLATQTKKNTTSSKHCS